jgi:hypothetical protein
MRICKRVHIYSGSAAKDVNCICDGLFVSASTFSGRLVIIILSNSSRRIYTTIMKGFLAIVACASAVVALPSPSDGNETETNATYLVPSTAANCEPGLNYCFEQIVRDLGALVSLFPIIHFAGSLAAQRKSLLRFYLPDLKLTIFKVSRNKGSCTNTATKNSETMRYLVMPARNGRGRSTTAGTDQVRGTRCLSVQRGKSIRSRSGAIGARQASAFSCRRAVYLGPMSLLLHFTMSGMTARIYAG